MNSLHAKQSTQNKCICFAHSSVVLKKHFSVQNSFHIGIRGMELRKVSRKFIPSEFIKSTVRYHLLHL